MEKTKDPFLVKLAEADCKRNAKKNDLLAKVREVDQIADSPPENSFTADEYSEFSKLSRGNARDRLRELLKKGKLRVVFKSPKGQKHYALVDEAEQGQRFAG